MKSLQCNEFVPSLDLLLLRLTCNLFGGRLVPEIGTHHAVCGASDLKLNCGMSYQQ